jgi:hypothetical protein
MNPTIEHKYSLLESLASTSWMPVRCNGLTNLYLDTFIMKFVFTIFVLHTTYDMSVAFPVCGILLGPDIDLWVFWCMQLKARISAVIYFIFLKRKADSMKLSAQQSHWTLYFTGVWAIMASREVHEFFITEIELSYCIFETPDAAAALTPQKQASVSVQHIYSTPYSSCSYAQCFSSVFSE